MPPRRKSRRLAEPTVPDATELHFVPDPVEIQPHQAVAAFAGEDNRSDTLVSTTVAALSGQPYNRPLPCSPPMSLKPPYKTMSRSLLADQVVRVFRILRYSIVLQFL